MNSSSRTFPCEGCGAELTFNVGVQQLKCEHCGFVKTIELSPDAAVVEQDFEGLLARLRERRGRTSKDDGGQQSDAATGKQLHCHNCGAVVRFEGTITATECAYCGASAQLEDIQSSDVQEPVDGVLAFRVERTTAQEHLVNWVRSRWFAPGAFTRQGVQGRFNGVYLPYWTFDSLTATHYAGRRGEHYFVTVGSGKNRRTVMRTRWYPASGAFQRLFDDLLIVASTGIPTKRVDALEPWPVHQCTPFSPALLAGFLARTYDVQPDAGFASARERMEEQLRQDVRARIGGDVQQIDSMHVRYDAVTYKHLLLPVWMMAYRFRTKSFQVVVNACTGEVQGDRPWSWFKVTGFILALAGTIGAFFVFAANQ